MKLDFIRYSRFARLFSAVLVAVFAVFLWVKLGRATRLVQAQTQPLAESVPATVKRPTPYRSPNRRHKIKVTDRQLALAWINRGAQLLADYGGTQLLSVDESLSSTLSLNSSLPEKTEWRDVENILWLNAGAFDTTQFPAKEIVTSEENSLHLVQFVGPILPAWRQQLERTGVEIIAYIPNNAYLVFGNSKSLGKLQSWGSSNRVVQWLSPFKDEYKLEPSLKNIGSKQAPSGKDDELYAVQLVSNAATNQVTLQLINSLRIGEIKRQTRVLRYVNVIVRLPLTAVKQQLAKRPDVVSITRYAVPVKQDERQTQLVAGNLTNGQPTPGDYLTYLAGKGFNQAQFDASNFIVNLNDSGIDTGTPTPNHFGLYTGGLTSNASRIAYQRLEGTPNTNSTLEGCDGHGTLNAHILGGFVPSGAPFNAFPHADGSGFRYGLGVAPFVKMGATVIFDPLDYTFPDLLSVEGNAYISGARISSNSWGSNNGATYNVDAQTYDVLVRDAQPTGSSQPAAGNQELVVLFSAGNNGPTTTSISAPGTAKNVITVGATEGVNALGANDGCNTSDQQADNGNEVFDRSSQGPTADGRRKPDLLAPGTHLTGGVPQAMNPGSNGSASSCFQSGAQAICGGALGARYFPANQQFYTASSGTSHAVPAVAGAAALLRQHFINNSLTPPSPAMTKAVLMNAARYLNGSGANDSLWSNVQGMGAVNLTNAFDALTGSRILRDQMAADVFTASGQERTFTGTIADTGKPLRVTLAWTDVPGSTAGNSWVNNLDLELVISGQTYRGNVFSGAYSATGGTADERNNVESIFLPAGTSGSFILRVKATNIAGDGVPESGGALDQDFALFASNVAPATQPVFETGTPALTAENCAPANNVLDPGETVTVSLPLRNIGALDTTNLTATLQATGGVTNPSAAQTYGALVANGAAVAQPFTFTVSGTCGGTLTATLQLQDGVTNLGVVTFLFNLGVTNVGTTTFSQMNAIAIPNSASTVGSGPADPYPSTITVAGVTATVTKVTVTLNGYTHTNPDDVDVLLVSPTGQKISLMTDAGGATDVNGVNLTFDDAGSPMPDGSAIPSGTYSPSNFGGEDTFDAPAPAGPYATTLAGLQGQDPNGVWSLYVLDDADDDVGTFTSWSLAITTSVTTCCAPTCNAITVNPGTALTAAIAGTSYSQTFTATGTTGAVTFSATGTLPPGLTLSSGGTLSGIPTQTGTFNFSVVALDSLNCTGNRAYALMVNCDTITVTPTTQPPNGLAGAPYSHSFSATGGLAPRTFAATGSLPNGLTLSSAGLLSGTPTVTGTFTFDVVATDAAGCTGTRNYTLQIPTSCPTILVTPSVLPTWIVNAPFSQKFTANGGTGPFTFTITAGALPAGIMLATDGTLSGTPSQAGTFSFTLTAAAANGCRGNRNLTFNVNACPSGGCGTLTATPNPIPLCTGATSGATSLSWTAPAGVTATSVHLGSPAGTTIATGGNSGTQSTDGSITNGSLFYLMNDALNELLAAIQVSTTSSGQACTVTLPQSTQLLNFPAKSFTFNVTAAPGVPWSATSNAAWLSITGGAAGTGDGTVTVAAQANTGAPRTGTITVGDKTFTVNQKRLKNASTVGIMRASDNSFYLRNQNSSGFADLSFIYGQAGDIPLSGDWNGDGIDSIGIYRNGTFYLRNNNSTGFADYAIIFGMAGDSPVVGDWDGDGIDTIGIFRNGVFYLRNSNTNGAPDLIFAYGVGADQPVAGDWDGDGIDTIGLFRSSTALFYLRNSNTTGFADIVITYGIASDVPLAGDWNGDGIDSVGIKRNINFYLRNTNSTGVADISFVYGSANDLPVAGDWNGLP